RGLVGLRIEGDSITNGRVVAEGFEGAALSFRFDETGGAAFDGGARFSDRAAASRGRDWLQRSLRAFAPLAGLSAELDTGPVQDDATVPLTGKVTGMDRLWERMLAGKGQGAHAP